MGSIKQLLPYKGCTLVEYAIQQAQASGFDPVVVVLGAQAEAVGGAVAHTSALSVVNENWASGMGSSITCGAAKILELSPDVDSMAVLLADQPLTKGDRVSVLVNSLGATPPEELYILYRRLRQRIDAIGVEIVMPLVGRYATSMEMTGATLTVCRLDDELERLLLAPCHCAFWTVTE